MSLADLRPLVEAEMTDTCTITRDVEGVGDDVFDETTGEYTAPASDTVTVYTGPCLFPAAGRRMARDEEQAGAAVFPEERDCRIRSTPSASERGAGWPPDLGDVLTVTAVGSDGDPSLVDRPLTVVGIERVSKQVAIRLNLHEAQRGPRV